MQSKGLDFLRPIWMLIYSDEDCGTTKGLNLSENDVSVSYVRYVNNHKNTTKDEKPNDQIIDDAIEAGLTPGKKFQIFVELKVYLVGSALVKKGQHAMILDSITDGKFVFKNTYAENKRVKMDIDAEEAPEEFFFLHINLTVFSLKTRFSCASMLRTSCILFIRQCYQQGLIDDEKRKQLEKYMMEEKVHVEIRNLMMMTLVPKPLHEDGDRQAAYLRATVSRVR